MSAATKQTTIRLVNENLDALETRTISASQNSKLSLIDVFGSPTRKFLELVDMLNKRKVDVVYIQETKWKGGSTKKANGFKLWYSGVGNTRNDAGIMISSLLKENVVEVNRVGDRIMKLKFVVNEEVVNIALMGGFGFGTRNKSGWDLLEFALAHELVIVNSCFKKRDDHLITLRSGGCNSQIGYLLTRKCIMDYKNCKVFSDEACTTQHRFLDNDIRNIWHNYFRELFNEERISVRELGAVSESNIDFGVQLSMSRVEVRGALQKMGRGKVMGPDQIPIEVWLCLGEERDQWLTRLFDTIFRTGDIPHEWRISMVVTIYKNKEDAKNCSNYRGINQSYYEIAGNSD
ncbi:uncharacterized protein LOC141718810 [Apium graveolens]|uniref:uncharacterized protein LOC141718810 n=1 Tax=Apium graveolens TaxID=4045 RepID=UPI003D7B8C5A